MSAEPNIKPNEIEIALCAMLLVLTAAHACGRIQSQAALFSSTIKSWQSCTRAAISNKRAPAAGEILDSTVYGGSLTQQGLDSANHVSFSLPIREPARNEHRSSGGWDWVYAELSFIAGKPFPHSFNERRGDGGGWDWFQHAFHVVNHHVRTSGASITDKSMLSRLCLGGDGEDVDQGFTGLGSWEAADKAASCSFGWALSQVTTFPVLPAVPYGHVLSYFSLPSSSGYVRGLDVLLVKMFSLWANI
jgi:hypothetical protein